MSITSKTEYEIVKEYVEILKDYGIKTFVACVVSAFIVDLLPQAASGMQVLFIGLSVVSGIFFCVLFWLRIIWEYNLIEEKRRINHDL